MFYRTLHSSLIIAVFLLMVSFIFNRDFSVIVDADHAPEIKHLFGYAWSSNIGWISMSGDTSENPPRHYGVDYNTSSPFLLSGYAWSSNIGWISFGCGNDDDGATGRKVCSEGVGVPNYPVGNGTSAFGPRFDSINNKLVGFARACSVFVSGCSGALRDSIDLGGWDGWISMSGDTSENPPFHYGVWFNSATQAYNGFAWGGGQEDDGAGNNISPQFPGWISFSGTGAAAGGGGDGTGTCFDNIQNGDENLGVDVGGRCGDLGPNGDGSGGPVGGLGGTCFDNELNGNELQVDLGGRCSDLGPNGDGNPGDGTGTCFNNIFDADGGETGVDSGPRCGPGGPGVKLCNDPFCGTPPEAGAVCTRSAYPIVGEDITWRADITPLGTSYLWKVEINDPLDPPVPKPANGTPPNADYTVISGSLTSPEVTIKYLTEGPRKTTVEITDAGGAVLSCNAGTADLTTFDVLPLGFELIHSGSMTARFIRSIRTVTFPDVEVSAVANGDFNESVTLSFVRIEYVPDSGIPVLKTGANGTLSVAESFSTGGVPDTVIDKDANTLDTNDYEKVKLRLNLTKNQSASDTSLPSGNYKVYVGGSTGSGIYKESYVDLKIDNPSGGVIEI